MLQTLLKRELDKRNLPSGNLQYSLGYCQGDGVAFYGGIESSDLEILINALMTGKHKAAAKRAIDKGVSVGIIRIGCHRYNHFNSMETRIEDYYATDLTPLEIEALEMFETKLDEHCSDTSKELEAIGYTIIEQGSPLWALEDKGAKYSTERFVVEVCEVEDDMFQAIDYDDEYLDAIYEGLVAKTTRYCALKATVKSAHGLELGSAFSGGYFFDKDDKKYARSSYRQLAREAIAEAREAIESISLAA